VEEKLIFKANPIEFNNIEEKTLKYPNSSNLDTFDDNETLKQFSIILNDHYNGTI